MKRRRFLATTGVTLLGIGGMKGRITQIPEIVRKKERIRLRRLFWSWEAGLQG
jgi:hypothetical protein